MAISKKREGKLTVVNKKVFTPIAKKTTTAIQATQISQKNFSRFSKGAVGILKAAGVARSAQIYTASGQGGGERGRPRASYKYGMPIQQYKRLLSQRKALFSAQQQAQEQTLLKRGYSPDQIQRLRLQKQAQERYAPQKEKTFQQYVAENTITPGTQQILDRLRAIQNKGEQDNLNMQRIVRERALVNSESNLLKTKNLFGAQSKTFDLFDDTYNPLKAPNVFTENPNDLKILNTKRLSLLNTREAGNDLSFV